ncbi:MAG TPA: hypothetical protein VFD07_07020 [Candidatus Krumholzibacteria bacterium]|nr:hypothetical protein [Candidatus Krumholzibacteria bacterium]
MTRGWRTPRALAAHWITGCAATARWVTWVAVCISIPCFPRMAGGQEASAVGTGWTSPTTWWVASRTTGYWYESIDPSTGVVLARANFLQNVDASVSRLWDDHLDLRFAGRYADADLYPIQPTNETRWTVGYAQVRASSWQVRARLGRLFVQEGPAHHTLDGAWVKLNPARRVEVRAWGGSQAPADLEFDIRSIETNLAFGGRVLATVTPAVRLGVSGAQWEEGGEVAARPVGADATWFPLAGLRAFARAEYETDAERWQRIELLGDYSPGRGSPWLLRAQYLDRTPWIEQTSYFARFAALERVRLMRASARYQLANGLGGEIESFTSVIDTRTSARLGGAVLFRYGRVGYSALFGDSGEESQWFGDVDVPVRPWVRLAAGAVIATYALFEDAPNDMERDLVTLFGRATLDLMPGLRGVLEVQGLKNPDFDEDARILFGLDLFAGRGASKFGLGRGGWLQ